MPLDKSIKKTLVIGSGPVVIGKAADFDYTELIDINNLDCNKVFDETVEIRAAARWESRKFRRARLCKLTKN